MAKPRELSGTVDPRSSRKGGASALKIVMVGALVAFGGYSAVAGASILLGRASSGDASLAAKADIDCASSRFAWRPECQAEKPEVAAAEDDKGRRSRRRSIASPAVEPAPPASVPAAVAASAEPAVTASLAEPSPEAAPPVTRAIERRSAKRPEPSPVEPAPPPAPAAKEPKLVPAVPSREARSESLRFKAEPSAPEAERSIRAARSKVEEGEQRAARARIERPARRDAAQFASLPRERVRRPRPAEAWEPVKADGPASVDDGWRSRRDLRLARRRDRAPDRMGLPPGLTVTSVRTYQLPDGRLVNVHVRPRPEVVRALIAQHRANTARMVSASPWSGVEFER